MNQHPKKLSSPEFARWGIALLAVCLLAGCASDATVRERVPHYKPLAAATGQLRKAEVAIGKALRYKRSNPLVALGENMRAARTSFDLLQADPNNAAALQDYNFATARIIGIIRNEKLDPWTQPLTVPTSDGPMLLTHKPDPRPQWNPALYNFIPADQFDINGTYVRERAERPGVGAPLVAIGKNINPEWRADFGLRRVYHGVTAVLNFKDNRCVMEFLDPLDHETVFLKGKTFPLAANFTVPMAVLLNENASKVPKFARMFFPDRYADTARLVRLEPFNPNKRVVLVIHGLMDSPTTWVPMIINLRNNPDIRKHYQFWFFSYPSGLPYPYSAAILRRDLDRAEQMFPLHERMVVVGHSMGGCISRLLITDTTDRKLWQLQFGRTPEQMNLKPASRKILEQSLIFPSRPDVGRVIFIASPLRGSGIARNLLGRIGSSLIRTPRTLLNAGNEMFRYATFEAGDLRLRRAPNSIDTLSPNSRFVRNINSIPIMPGIPYHTIIGDRGRGDSPNSSDGVVPYWSSHMEGAVSEYIVPSGHGAHQNPQAFAEVARILKLNAGNN
jgi:pimeloyl-ACP methyl ester carboxylesterase